MRTTRLFGRCRTCGKSKEGRKEGGKGGGRMGRRDEERKVCVSEGKREGGREGGKEGGREGYVPGADRDKVKGVMQALDVVFLHLQPGVGPLRRLVLVGEGLTLYRKGGGKAGGADSKSERNSTDLAGSHTHSPSLPPSLPPSLTIIPSHPASKASAKNSSTFDGSVVSACTAKSKRPSNPPSLPPSTTGVKRE